MVNYQENISNRGISIYDLVEPNDENLYIPINLLEQILSESLIGHSLKGFALRTRSKVVKQLICKSLGYPIPSSFLRTQPRFPGQNFDVYSQKKLNVQIWNQDIELTRRYIFVGINEHDIIYAIRVITGEELALLDKTGKLTKKFQATMINLESSELLSTDTNLMKGFVSISQSIQNTSEPTDSPSVKNLLSIEAIYHKLSALIGSSLHYIDVTQERNRAAELHKQVCTHLGYSNYKDNGVYPDILNQLLEVKLQTSPTIDLGLHSPDEGLVIGSLNGINITSRDVRYAIFEAVAQNDNVYLKKLYMISGECFSSRFKIWNKTNSKIQLPLPRDFFI